LSDKFCEKVNEPVHLCTASDGTAETLIGFATLFLFLPLGSSCLPVVGDRFGGAIRYVSRNFLIAHIEISLSDFSVLFQGA
jgi:hypothetical protein